MRRLSIIVLLFSFGLCACGTDGEIEEIIKLTKEVEIKKLDTTGNIVSAKVLDDRKEFEQLLSVISNAEAPSYKCGFDYEIKCKLSDNNFIAIELNSADICAVASFVYDDELMFRYLNKEKIEELEKHLD